MYQQSGIYLYCVGGCHAGEIFPLEEDAIIMGRNAQRCAIVYADTEPGISGIHCQVRLNGDGVELTDLGSSYGTFLNNGVKLAKNIPQCLMNGEGFYIGNKTNKFLIKVK